MQNGQRIGVGIVSDLVILSTILTILPPLLYMINSSPTPSLYFLMSSVWDNSNLDTVIPSSNVCGSNSTIGCIQPLIPNLYSTFTNLVLNISFIPNHREYLMYYLFTFSFKFFKCAVVINDIIILIICITCRYICCVVRALNISLNINRKTIYA